MQPDTGDKLTSNSRRGLPHPQEGVPNCAVLRHELWMTTLCPDIKDQTYANVPKALCKVFISVGSHFHYLCMCIFVFRCAEAHVCMHRSEAGVRSLPHRPPHPILECGISQLNPGLT